VRFLALRPIITIHGLHHTVERIKRVPIGGGSELLLWFSITKTINLNPRRDEYLAISRG
jgi:hypothetical protein